MTMRDAHSARADVARAAGATAIAVLVAVAALPGRSPAQARMVESTPSGDIELEARGAPVADVLQAIAAESGFDVAMTEGATRRSVHAALEPAPVEDVLREILRERNYALIFDGDDVRQVILLDPPGVRSARPAPAPRRNVNNKRRRTNNKHGAGPVVVRR